MQNVHGYYGWLSTEWRIKRVDSTNLTAYAMAGNFVVYLIGYIIAIIGVGFLLTAAGVGQEWIIASVLILIGLGIVYALSRSQRDAAGRAASSSTGESRNPSRSSGKDHSEARSPGTEGTTSP